MITDLPIDSFSLMSLELGTSFILTKCCLPTFPKDKVFGPLCFLAIANVVLEQGMVSDSTKIIKRIHPQFLTKEFKAVPQIS